jgi:Zn-dependent alcohol dehydrogenase
MRGADLPLQVCDITLDPPKEAEVCVRIAAAGVCHSDLMAYEWNGAGMMLPVVLGHEASGVVEAVGPGVTHLQKGDHVVLTPNPQCHHCGYCDRGQWTLCETSLITATGHALDGTTRMHLNDVPLSPLAGLGAFSELTVVPATSVVKIDRDMPLAEAALIGCAVITGFGAAVMSHMLSLATR